ncbi:MAG: DNA-protecting protein DprA [Planctomycetota bacterium]|nr:MAG: DNA-protecting protein DprA [Planctomycetota bacterium]
MQDLLLRLRLARAAGVGARGARTLERAFGLSVLFGSDPLPDVPARVLRALRDPGLARAAREELELHASHGWKLLGLGDPVYPPALREIHDPPQVLSVWGSLSSADREAVAVVGARRATHEGRAFAHDLARDLAAAGVTVVSGLARGIDAAAHRGALAAGGRTLAVLGCGLGRLPAHQQELAAQAAAAGAVLSEFHPHAGARRHTFPQRNRVVAGLCAGVVVVQAGPRSGALITADFALGEGRELFAVPGFPREPLARGPNALLRDGARLVESAEDVLAVLRGVEAALGPGDLTPEERGLLAALGEGAETAEALAARARLGLYDVLRLLGRLERKGLLRSDFAGRWRPCRLSPARPPWG